MKLRKQSRSLVSSFVSALLVTLLLAACAAPAAPAAEKAAPAADPTSAPAAAAPTAVPAVAAAPTAAPPAEPKEIVIPWWFWEEVVQISWNLHKVPRLIGGRLVDLNIDGAITPYLAEKFSLSEDGLTYTFNLRQGVTWHDGEQFDAEDVIFTLNYLVNEKNRAASGGTSAWGSLTGAEEYKKGTAKSIAGLEMVDNYTVRMSIPLKDGGWLTNVPTAVNILPEHIYKDIPIESIQENHAPIWFEPRMHIGTGPFKWVEGVDEKFVKLTPFDDYWEGKPLLDGITFSNVGELDTQYISMQKSEIHYFPLSGPYYKQAKLNVGFQETMTVLEFDRPYHRWLDINLDKPYLQDVRVRQALNYAVDRQLLSDTVLVGLAQPWYSVIEHDKWVNAKMPKYEYNVEKAKELLAAAAADGAWDPNQEIGLYYYYPDSVSKDFMAGLQAQFTAAGFKTNLIYVESAVSSELDISGDYDLMYSGWGAAPDPTAYARGFDCKDGGAFFRKYKPETCQKVWDLFEQGKQEPDFAKRKALYDEVQQIYGEEAIAVPLFRFRSAVSINNRLTGFELGSQVFFNSWIFSKHNAHLWDLLPLTE